MEIKYSIIIRELKTMQVNSHEELADGNILFKGELVEPIPYLVDAVAMAVKAGLKPFKSANGIEVYLIDKDGCVWGKRNAS